MCSYVSAYASAPEAAVFARAAAVFGIFYLALMYILNPPHFGHTGESHFLYIDRNVVEICMLLS